METWIEQLGRLHPLVLHMPIGVLILLVLLELGNLLSRGRWSSRLPDLTDGTRTFILFILGVSTILSAAFGLMLADGGGYNSSLLFDHRMYGLLCAALVLVLFLVQQKAVLYAGTLVATVVVMVLAGHNGGSLTHGKGYLAGLLDWGRTEVVAEPEVLLGSVDEVELFAHAIQPIFEDSCVSCHGENKQKGELRLDSWEAIQRGGESGERLIEGGASRSQLVKRIELPVDHEDHMPPDGKPQLSIEEIRLFGWWVDAGAPSDALLVDLEIPKAIYNPIISRLGFEPEKVEPLPDRTWVLSEALRLEEGLGIFTQPLHPEEPWLEVNARLQLEAFGDDQLAALQPLARVIQRLDLGETAVSDAGLQSLGTFENLEVLKLDRTQITDAGLEALSNLLNLRTLVLFSTAISDEGLDALDNLPKLKSVFLWQSQVSKTGAAELQEQLTDDRTVRQLKEKINELEVQIQNEHVQVNLGESVTIVNEEPESSKPEE